MPQAQDPLRRFHSSATSPIVFGYPSLIQAIKDRSNRNTDPHSAIRNRRTFWVLRYVPSADVCRPIGSLCQSNLLIVSIHFSKKTSDSVQKLGRYFKWLAFFHYSIKWYVTTGDTSPRIEVPFQEQACGRSSGKHRNVRPMIILGQ